MADTGTSKEKFFALMRRYCLLGEMLARTDHLLEDERELADARMLISEMGETWRQMDAILERRRRS